MVAVRFQPENRHPEQRVFQTSAQRLPGVCILKLLLLAKVLIRKRPNWRFLKDLKTVLMPRKPFKNPIFKRIARVPQVSARYWCNFAAQGNKWHRKQLE